MLTSNSSKKMEDPGLSGRETGPLGLAVHRSSAVLLPSFPLVSRPGLAVRLYYYRAVKQTELGSIPLRFSSLFRKVVVCGHCLVTLSSGVVHFI